MKTRTLFDLHTEATIGHKWAEFRADPGAGGDDSGGDSGNGDDGAGDDGGSEDDGPAALGLKHAAIAERKKRQAAEAKAKELADRLAALESAAEKAAREKAEKEGKFEDLYRQATSQLDEFKGKLSQYEQREAARVEALTEQNNAAIESLPEHLRELIPEGMTPDQLSRHLAKLSKIAGDDDRPKGTRTRGAKVTTQYPAESRAFAAKHGMTPEDGHAAWLHSAAGKEWAKHHP